MTTCETQLTQLQELCQRTLEILNEEKFFDKTMDNEGFWYSTLERDLTKAAKGKEFKMFQELLSRATFKDKDE